MYLVAIAWIYVVLMMAVAEALSSQGTVLGAVITFVLYGVLPLSVVLYIMGAPGAPAGAPRPREAGGISARQTAAAQRPVTPSRRNEKNRDASSTVQAPAPADGVHAGARPDGRAPAAAGRPASAASRRRAAGSTKRAASAAPGSARRPAARRRRPRSGAGRCTGPSQATHVAAARPPAPAHSAATVASSTPAASPRQPACAAATARPSRSAISTGRQSATSTVQATPGSVVQAASAGGSGAARRARRPAARTRAPCTCRSQTGRAPSAAAKRAPVLGHRRRVVADRAAEVQAGPRRRADAPGALAHRRAHARRRRPVGAQQRQARRHSASGQASGRVRSKASSFMQASKTRMTCGTWSSRQSKRRALKICGTSTQSASVGVSPWQ